MEVGGYGYVGKIRDRLNCRTLISLRVADQFVPTASKAEKNEF
jgi:hypothetical protein